MATKKELIREFNSIIERLMEELNNNESKLKGGIKIYKEKL